MIITKESVKGSTLTTGQIGGPHTIGAAEEVDFNAHTTGSAEPAEFNEPEVVHSVGDSVKAQGTACGEPQFFNALDIATGRATAQDPYWNEKVATLRTKVEVMNGAVLPNMRLLLGEVIGVIDASIPNKDQNRAIKHLVRSAFDRAYFDINSRVYPEANYAQGPGYALSPETDRTKAFSPEPVHM